MEAFAKRFMTISFGNEEYSIIPTETTTWDDMVEQRENLQTVVKAVLESVEQLDETDEKVSMFDIIDTFVQTVSENLTDNSGNPFSVFCDGVGLSIVEISF